MTAAAAGTTRNWGAWAITVWGVLFAVPSFVWAMGGTLGATSTVSPDLVKMAHDGVKWFLTVLWLTGFLKLFASWIGVAMTRPRGARLSRFATFCGGGAAVLLAGHGMLFVVRGVLAETGIAPVKADLAGLVRWYLYLWGPYFVLGGVAFGAATVWYLRRTDERPSCTRYALAGSAGGLLVVLMSTVSGIG